MLLLSNLPQLLILRIGCWQADIHILRSYAHTASLAMHHHLPCRTTCHAPPIAIQHHLPLQIDLVKLDLEPDVLKYVSKSSNAIAAAMPTVHSMVLNVRDQDHKHLLKIGKCIGKLTMELGYQELLMNKTHHASMAWPWCLKLRLHGCKQPLGTRSQHWPGCGFTGHVVVLLTRTPAPSSTGSSTVENVSSSLWPL